MSDHEKALREAIAFVEGPAPEAQQCARCGGHYVLDADEDDNLCHPCAHGIVESVIASAPDVLADVEHMRAEIATLRADRDAARRERNELIEESDGLSRRIERLSEELDEIRAATHEYRATDELFWGVCADRDAAMTRARAAEAKLPEIEEGVRDEIAYARSKADDWSSADANVSWDLRTIADNLEALVGEVSR